jgi:two-component system alkaline phosphatase synthesis response regulator PhoP
MGDELGGGEVLKGRKILVVDDEPDALEQIASILEDNGATIVRARDGDEAIELARKEKPDLMTLDLAMPGKSGVEVFVEVRKDPELCRIPICIITGRPEMRKLIYERPAHTPPEGYLDKPVTEKVLIRNIRKIFELRGHKG